MPPSATAPSPTAATPYGSDAEEMFIDIVWWVNQEVLHHGAEIALLRDLYRDSSRRHGLGRR
jgi:hypothetical protein